MIRNRRWCPEGVTVAPLLSYEATPSNSCRHVGARKSSVTFNESVHSGIFRYPQPPPIPEQSNNRRNLAARQYINYCNTVNNTSPVIIPAACCLHGSVHRPLIRPQEVQPSAAISLRDVMDLETDQFVVSPVNEDMLIKAMHRATTEKSVTESNTSIMHLPHQPTNFHLMSRPPSDAQDLMRSRSRQGLSRRFLEHDHDQSHSNDLMVVHSSTVQPSRPKTCLPYSHGSSLCDIANSSCASDCITEHKAASDAAKQALLAIYQAGKPDNRFHVRAPNTAALEAMLAVLTNDSSENGDCQSMDCHNCRGQLLDQRRVCCQHVSCMRRPGNKPVPSATCRRVALAPNASMTSNFISTSETKPVKVNVECAPNTDTLVSFRVKSVPI